MTETGDQSRRELGYPVDVLAELLTAARDRHRKDIKKHRRKKFWRNKEARWYVWKACYELFWTYDCIPNGEYAEVLSYSAGTVNNILFAIEIVGETAEGESESHGYPESALSELLTASEAQFRENVEKHGPGKNWLNDEPRWHLWKACDELFSSRDYAHYGEYAEALPHFADAVNHLLFAIEIVGQADEERDMGRTCF